MHAVERILLSIRDVVHPREECVMGSAMWLQELSAPIWPRMRSAGRRNRRRLFRAEFRSFEHKDFQTLEASSMRGCFRRPSARDNDVVDRRADRVRER